MRFIKTMLTAAGMLVATAATRMTAPLMALQDPPIKVDVHTSETHTVWYTDPVWLAIGGLVVLLIIVLAIVAGRGRDSGSSTTVVR